MKRFFHSELEEFRSHLVLMGEKALDAVETSVRGLVSRDVSLCNQVIAGDDALDELEILSDSEGMRYISLRSPVASELRLVMIGMQVGRDLERVGDEASTVAKRARHILPQAPTIDLFKIPEMASLTVAMLRDAIDCFLEMDADKARALIPKDRLVDDLNRENYRLIAAAIAGETSPAQVECHLDLIFISKSLERVADHATNLAEEVIYLSKGEDVRHSTELKELKKQGH